MAQQKIKKSSPWLTCEQCSTILLHKDKESHANSDCPPSVRNIKHTFVKDHVLYGTLEVKTVEDIKNLSSREVDNLVFLSQSVIQLCNLSIGDWAIIEALDVTEDISSVAKIVWPTSEKTLTSVLMTKNALNLNLTNDCSFVKVSKMPSHIPHATAVTLVALNMPKSLEVTSELYNRISRSYEGRYLMVRNKIGVMFYGKPLKFEVKVVTDSTCEVNLEKDFSRLTVFEKSDFFQINGKTKWIIHRDGDDYKQNDLLDISLLQPAGVDDELIEIREMIQCCLHKTESISLSSIQSVLLYGSSGTGKTMIANFLAKESKMNTITICAPDLYSKYSGSAEDAIKEMFQDAIDHMPSIIILDEVDILCPPRNSKLSDAEKRIVSTLLLMLDSLSNKNNKKVFVIATTNKIDNIDASFRRPGRLEREIEISTPTPKSRKAILSKLLNSLSHNISEEELDEIASQTHGFVGADVVSLISQAAMNAARRPDRIVKENDFKFALKKVRPSAMREVQIEVPNVKWSDIGGQDKLKLILKQAVEWPLKYSSSFLRLGVTPPKGVLMFGPPGCSKTMIAKALASESGLNFLSIKGPELFSKWVGESERAVREVFRKARQVAPSIIFFDEIDALGGERSSGSSTSVQERVLAQLLTELDGVTPLEDVTVLAATNRPDRIDKALLRPGRLDRIVYVPLPDEMTRREILRIKLSKMPVNSVSIDDLVERTERYSGAEITAICHEAAMMALEENLDIEHVESRHFEEAFKLVTPRTPSSLIKLYEDYLEIKK